MARFNKNTLYTTKDIAREIMKACPNHYKTEASCITTVSYIIKRNKIQPVNRQRMFRLFSGIDSESVYKEITEMVRQGQEPRQLQFDLSQIIEETPEEKTQGFNSEQISQLETIIRKVIREEMQHVDL